MISRRLLRTKVMQIYYAWAQENSRELSIVDNELDKSVHCTLELYYEVLAVLSYLADYEEKKINQAKAKNLPTYEDLHPKTNFINNKAIKAIQESYCFKKQTKAPRIPFEAHEKLIRNLYNNISATREFQEYLNTDNPGMKKDKNILIFIIHEFIVDNEEFDKLIEEYALHWNDDIGFVCSILEKSIQRIKKPGNDNFLMIKEYACEADKEFGKKLLNKAIINDDEYEAMINHHSKNWDIERIATIDKTIMKLAITEFLHMPTVPVKVTINEYIEISKYYSTQKSNSFINGLLDQIVDKLKKENRIKKEGRGLIE